MPNQQPLRLFSVTLPWNPSDEEEGDYANKTWAVDEGAAVRNIAVEMSEHSQSGCETQEERDRFVASLIEAAGPYAADSFGDRILNDVYELLKGTDDAISQAAKADYDAVAAIMVKYGIFNPFPAK